MYRIEGGNDRLATALAAPLGDRLHLNTDVVALSHRGKVVRVSVKSNRALVADHLRLRRPRAAGDAAAAHADYAGAAGAAARGDRPAQVRPRHQDAAAVLEALLARGRTSARVRLAAAVRRGLGRQRRTARPRRHPDAARRRRRQRRDAGDRRQARRTRSGRRARLARVEGQPSCWPRGRSSGSRIRTRAAATPTSIPASIRRCAPGCRGRRAGCSSPASTPASSGRAT